MWQIDYPTNKFVSRHRGTLPVILTCPHDGIVKPPGVPVRTGQGSSSSCDFEIARDLNARVIATGVAQRLLDNCGEAPYVVMADFGRKYIDANRSRDCAYEVDQAQPFYDEYHDTLRSFIEEIRAENGGLGLLFDVHGTAGLADDPADIYLGTDDGQTIDRLKKIDPQVIARHRGIRGLLGAAGYVLSPKQPDLPEAPALKGGFTVRTYGSSHPDGLDAIQLEIILRLRKTGAARDVFIEHLAFAISCLIARYAGTHTLAAFQSIHLFSAGDAQSRALTGV